MKTHQITTKILLILTVLATFASCSLSRSMIYWGPDIDDHKIFYKDTVRCSDNKFHFHKAESDMVFNPKITITENSKKTKTTLDSMLRRTSTVAFVIIKNDTILFEKYYNGHSRDQVSTVFSMTKSVTSTLIGIAIDQGYITSVHDTVTKYIPELKNRDPNFSKLTIEHLLNMRSGLKFNENVKIPLTKITRLHYGSNIMGLVKNMKFEHEPGTVHEYLSISTTILGIVLERATKTSFAKYLEQNLWKPLGMEYDASVNMDSKRNRVSKAYGGLNASAIDLAKIGRLYLNNGKWNGKQILPENWVKKCTEPNPDNNWYSYQWYNGAGLYKDSTGYVFKQDSISAVNYANSNKFKSYSVFKYWGNNKWGIIVPENSFQAIGIMKQVMHVDKNNNVIIVRLGASSDSKIVGNYINLLDELAKKAD
jgi:CubicO group peptidase (beta-lactamase class C family)